jgi:sec-independent protein translocase protein TatB
MLDVAPQELLMVAVVALLVIGPKDLPKAMRIVGKWVGKARGVARQFRSGFDTMVRESELAEMEAEWAKENERIMREHPQPALPSPEPEQSSSEDDPPLMVERPELTDVTPLEEAPPPAKPKRVRKPKPKPESIDESAA